MKNTPTLSLEALLKRFQKGLPDRMHAIEELWMHLLIDHWSKGVFEDLCQQVHTLGGTAGTLGFTALGVTAQTLETQLRRLERQNNLPRRKIRAQVHGQLTRLWNLIVPLQKGQPPTLPQWSMDTEPPEAPQRESGVPATLFASPPTILVVDDDPEMMDLLVLFLRKTGYCVAMASSGQDALHLLEREQPEMILLDASMPEMDGFELCAAIKKLPERQETPVIMVTGLSDTQSVSRAFQVGAEEYVTKPIHWEVLRQRMRLLIQRHRAEVERRTHLDRLLFEREFIETIILRMRANKQFSPQSLRFLLAPVEKTAGDILLSALRPNGEHHLMIGDFTGHGLPAAMGGPMVSDIFYTMTGKDLPMQEIVDEIIRRLVEKMPTGMFMTACFLALNRQQGRLKVWNCAMPELLIYRRRKIIHRFASNNIPLGILDRPVAPPVSVMVQPGDRVYAYSDGVVEESDRTGGMFGQEKLEKLLRRMIARKAPLELVSQTLTTYRSTLCQHDDITMVELTC